MNVGYTIMLALIAIRSLLWAALRKRRVPVKRLLVSTIQVAVMVTAWATFDHFAGKYAIAIIVSALLMIVGLSAIPVEPIRRWR